MDIDIILKEKRAEYQLTQEQLAEKIFVSKKTISNWETQKTTPDIDSLIRLANLFDLSLDNLLLEGSNIVENIKKQEAAKIARTYFWISWCMNIVFVLIILVVRKYGGHSSISFVLFCSAILLNSSVMFHFTKEVRLTNGNQSPYQILKAQNKWILGIVLVLIFMIIILVFGLI